MVQETYTPNVNDYTPKNPTPEKDNQMLLVARLIANGGEENYKVLRNMLNSGVINAENGLAKEIRERGK